METIKQFIKYFEEDRTNAEYILVFDQNKRFLSEIDFHYNSESLVKLISIKIYKYGNALANEREYKKLSILIDELKKDLKKISKSKNFRILEEGVDLLQGKNLNYQKKYWKSNKIFKNLISKNNEYKQGYEKWYKFNLEGISNRVLLAVAIPSFIFVVISFFIDFENIFLNYLGGIILIFAGIFQWIYKKFYLKK